MKKIVLGIMILLLAGVLVAQSSFATSLINLGNEQTDGNNNTPSPAASSVTENNTDLNNTPNPTATPMTTGNNNAQGNSLGNNSENNSGLNNSLTNNYIYNNSSNNASLPKTGLDNTVLFILTAVALISVVVTFKKISDYGNI